MTACATWRYLKKRILKRMSPTADGVPENVRYQRRCSVCDRTICSCYLFHIHRNMTFLTGFPVWNDSCVNSSTIVLSSRYYSLHASCPVWVVLPIEYHFCYTSDVLLHFYLNLWTICPKAAFLFFVLEETKKEHSCFYT